MYFRSSTFIILGMHEFQTIWQEMTTEVYSALENAEETGSGLQLEEIRGMSIELTKYNPTYART